MIKKIVYGLLILWALAYAASFIIPVMTEPSGDGFTRGMNRITAFFGWQMIAGLFGLTVWYFGRTEAASRVESWLFRIPLLLAGLLFLFVVGLILWAMLSKPPPTTYEPPDMTTSADAMPIPEDE